MHYIQKHRLHLLLLVLYLTGCKSAQTLVGNDKDRHGCIGSAGYTWSDLRQECVRPFEVGLHAIGTNDPTRAAYLLFSSDSLRAELFLPSGKEIVIRENQSHQPYRYTAPRPSTTVLIKSDSGWQIHQNKQLHYEYKQ